MRFIAFTDIHQNRSMLDSICKQALSDDIDFIVCCGDMSDFGEGLTLNFKKLNSIGKPVIVVPGNHEEMLDFDSVCLEYENIINIDRNAIEINGKVFVGYGGGGFDYEDEEFPLFMEHIQSLIKNKDIVLVLHQPVYGTKLDLVDNRHVGNKSFRECIEKFSNVKFVLSGHIHECFFAEDVLNQAKLVNPANQGKIIEV